jgi:putative oxidoreductase
VLRDLVARVLATRAHPIPLVIRVGAGAVFFAFSFGKFRRHDAEANAFDRYGIPFPDVTTYLVGTLEFIGGLLLIAGLLTRPAAVALLGNMAGALATAGRIEPNFTHTALPAILIVAMLVLVWTGGGARSIDRTLCDRIGRTPSGHAPSIMSRP